MRVAIVQGYEGVRTQLSTWRLEKDLAEAERILQVRRKAVIEQERKVENLRALLRARART